MSIEVKSVTKRFGGVDVLRDVSLTVGDGELVALLGPSGSGKTTLLRIIAGLECADGGRVLFDGIDVADKQVGARRVGFVFQHYALFRHMTVHENVAFGLRVQPRSQRLPDAVIRRRVRELLQLVQLEAYADRFPNQLSGGQRQRIALARALAIEPRVLLLDEPFAALDAKVRKDLRRWIRRLHEDIHVTSIFVTHDQDEALELADRIVITNEGRIEQSGTPNDIFHEPASEFVATFLGQINLFHGRRDGQQLFFANRTWPGKNPDDAHRSGPVRIFIRPHDFAIATVDREGSIRARVRYVHSARSFARVHLDSDSGEELVVDVPHESSRDGVLAPGQDVYLEPKRVRIFGG